MSAAPLHLVVLLLLLLLLLLLELQLLLVLLVGRLVDKHNTAGLIGFYSLIILVLVLLAAVFVVVLSSVLPVGGVGLSLVVPIVHVIIQGLVLLLVMGLAGLLCYGGVGSASNEYTAIHLLLQSKLINKPRSYYFHLTSKIKQIANNSYTNRMTLFTVCKLDHVHMCMCA